MTDQKGKKMTLRQRLRDDSEKKLDLMLKTMWAAGVRVCEEHESGVDAALLMQLASQPKQGKTLRNTLITQLANEAEEVLEALYNKQLDIDLPEEKE